MHCNLIMGTVSIWLFYVEEDIRYAPFRICLKLNFCRFPSSILIITLNFTPRHTLTTYIFLFLNMLYWLGTSLTLSVNTTFSTGKMNFPLFQVMRKMVGMDPMAAKGYIIKNYY